MIRYRALIAILLIIGILIPSVSSALISDVTGVAQCSLLNGIVLLIVSRVVNKAVGLLNTAMDKAIEFLSFGFLKAPEKVQVVNDDQAGVAAKELFKDTISRCIARQILSRMNQGILSLARKMGRDGGPTFVQNWRNFQTDAQYRGEDVFRAMLSNTKLCNYFGDDIKKLFDVKGKVSLSGQNTRTGNFDPFALRNNCTMPSGFNLTNYQNDFSGNGGWNAWSRMLEPQNNYYGTLFNSLNEASKQRALEESGDILETQGHGFTSKRGDDANSSCQLKGLSGKCIIFNKVETPGGIISELTAETLKSELNWLISVDELNEVIMNMYSVMVNRLTDLSGQRGLDEINPPIEGDPGLDENLPDRTPYPTEPLPGEEGVCNGTGNPDYAGTLQDAILSVVSANPEGIADALNTSENGFTFLNYVATELKNSGFKATTNVLNGNDNPNRGDLIAVWSSEDDAIERYDAIINSGAGNEPLKLKWGTDYTGDIPLSCASGG